jgi:hypothetical protein
VQALSLFLAVVAGCAPASVLAQGGSTGGTIGKQNKSVSGTEDKPTPSQRATPSTPKRAGAPLARKGCGNIVGVWSWSGGLFGSGDTEFRADGTASHRSGIVGTWVCRAGGEVYIDWKDWYKNRMKLSPDGKTLLNLEGGSTFSR